MVLTLTGEGSENFHHSRKQTQGEITHRLEHLSEEQLNALSSGLHILKKVFI